MSLNKQKNVMQITSDFYKICSTERPEYILEAMAKALATILVMNYKSKDVNKILIDLAKDVIKNYKEMHTPH
jgi:hypothetical protein